MNLAGFLLYTVMIHVFFMFLQIHKQSIVIKLSYERQRLEKTKSQFFEKKNIALTQREILYAPAYVSKKATEELKLKPLALNQVRSLSYE